jgi:LAO/AO transport system kinase
VIATSSLRGEGVDAVLKAIDGHREALAASGEIAARRAQIAERRLLKAGEEILRDRFERRRDGRLQALLESMEARTLSPHAAAIRLLNELSIGDHA